MCLGGEFRWMSLFEKFINIMEKSLWITFLSIFWRSLSKMVPSPPLEGNFFYGFYEQFLWKCWRSNEKIEVLLFSKYQKGTPGNCGKMPLPSDFQNFHQTLLGTSKKNLQPEVFHFLEIKRIFEHFFEFLKMTHKSKKFQKIVSTDRKKIFHEKN